jgi:hypothetical protein
MLLGAYFDESESQGAPPNVLTVAGYLVKDVQAKRMTREIGKRLARFGIEFFHQTECAQGTGQYVHLDKAERVQAQDYLRAIIKRRTMIARAASINIDDYLEIVGEGPGIPTPYAYACISVMNSVRRWIEETGFNGKIDYFFESGYKDERNSKRFVEYMTELDELKSLYCMIGHGHYNKRDVFPLRAADMLAWYTNQEFSRVKLGKVERRKDFAALLRPPPIDMRMDHNRTSLTELKRILDEFGGSIVELR